MIATQHIQNNNFKTSGTISTKLISNHPILFVSLEKAGRSKRECREMTVKET